MTEIKYIFPKQPQSMAVLAFIAVLIILFLVLIVMVHMRNRKLKIMLEEQMAERRLLNKICADFTAVYYVELGAIGTGMVAHNVSLLARYVSPVKKSESSIKELSGFLV